MAEAFNAVAYLQEQLPGFEFRAGTPTGGSILNTVQAHAVVHLTGKGDVDPVLLAVPEHERHARAWADELISVIRRDATQKLGLHTVIEDALAKQRRRHEEELNIVRTAKDALIGSAFSRGHENGYMAGYRAGKAALEDPERGDDDGS